MLCIEHSSSSYSKHAALSQQEKQKPEIVACHLSASEATAANDQSEQRLQWSSADKM